MSKKLLGFDIDAYSMKIAVCSKKKQLEDYLSVDLPENMIRDGKFISPDAMGDFIKETLKSHRLKGSMAAVALNSQQYYIRRVRLPKMTPEQLAINLPFEFHDYITGETKDYVFDYEVLGMSDKEMDLLAATTSKAVIETYKRIMKRAGLKLYKLVPDVLGIQSILLPLTEENPKDKKKKEKSAKAEKKPKKEKPAKKRKKKITAAEELAEAQAEEQKKDEMQKALEEAMKAKEEPKQEEPENRFQDYAVLSIMHDGTRLHFFSNGSYEITRDMNTGMKDVINAIVDQSGVDWHLADLMMMTNQDNILSSAPVQNILDQMTTEIMRVMNFYNYNNPKNNIDRILYCGGILEETLLPRIEEATGLPCHPLSEMVKGSEKLEKRDTLNRSPQAYGIITE